MARMRVHELAKESDLDSKDLLARMEKLGIRGKRSQSSLSDDETERIREELGVGDQRAVTIGEERVVTAESGQ